MLEDEITSIIKNLNNASPGWDHVSPHVMKKCYVNFLQPLTHICNLSIVNGVFPNEMKIAMVLPLFKSGSKDIVGNYRPISVLPYFSKILEKMFFSRLIKFLNKHKLLYPFQFGFRENHSTTMALSLLIDKITKALDDGHLAVGVFLDFSKAFDTVNHSILLSKLEHYGVRGLALQWVRSYLSERYQFVTYDKTNSSKLLITCGVPQGSILGPLLFLLYINDIANASEKLFSTLFADDTNVFLTRTNPTQIISTMNIELRKVVTWLNTNKLSLNVKKSHFIVFSSRKVTHVPNVIISGNTVERVTKTKFLGVVLDELLTWKDHIKYIKGKISRGVGIICKARRVLPQKSLITLYNSFVHPFFNYCLEVWGNTFPTHIDCLIKLQKKTIRLITGSPFNAHTSELFIKTNVLPLQKLYVMKIQLFLYKYNNSLLPTVFNDMFVQNREIHGHSTRNKTALHVPQIRLEIARRSLRYSATKIYNHFHQKIHYVTKLSRFKSDVKQYLLLHDLDFL